jgi:hypothetical protein
MCGRCSPSWVPARRPRRARPSTPATGGRVARRSRTTCASRRRGGAACARASRSPQASRSSRTAASPRAPPPRTRRRSHARASSCRGGRIPWPAGALRQPRPGSRTHAAWSASHPTGGRQAPRRALRRLARARSARSWRPSGWGTRGNRLVPKLPERCHAVHHPAGRAGSPQRRKPRQAGLPQVRETGRRLNHPDLVRRLVDLLLDGANSRLRRGLLGDQQADPQRIRAGATHRHQVV